MNRTAARQAGRDGLLSVEICAKRDDSFVLVLVLVLDRFSLDFENADADEDEDDAFGSGWAGLWTSRPTGAAFRAVHAPPRPGRMWRRRTWRLGLRAVRIGLGRARFGFWILDLRFRISGI